MWQDSKALVTGGRGMVGTQLVGALLRRGAQVIVLDDGSRASGPRQTGAIYIDADAGRIDDYRHLPAGISVVFNLAAAVAGVAYNQDNQVEMLTANSRLQTTPVLAALRMPEVHTFVQTSSVCVYGPHQNAPAQESVPLEPDMTKANYGYSLAKRIGEQTIALACAGRPGWRGIIVRPTNLYGPYDHFDERAHVIPALIKQVLDPDVTEIKVNGTGREVREFLFSADVAEGLLAVAEHGRAGEVYNLGTNGATAVPLKALIGSICTAAEVAKPITFVTRFDSGDERRWTDSGKAHHECGWSYRTDLATGLQRTIDWYRRRT